MFNIMIKCYHTVNNFKQEMFETIADQFDIHGHPEYYGQDPDDIKYNNSKDIDDEYGINPVDRVLIDNFGSYFTENYKRIFRGNDFKEEIRNYILSLEYCECLADIGSSCETLDCLDEYTVQCLDICWIMVLQDPPLSLTPIKWKAEDGLVYDDEMHKRILGSDRKCKKVLYFIWPVISSRNESGLDYQKIEVVSRDEMYRRQKGSSVAQKK